MRKVRQWIKKMRAKRVVKYDQPWQSGQNMPMDTSSTPSTFATTINWSSATNQSVLGGINSMSVAESNAVASSPGKLEDVRIEKKPVEVVGEIVAEKPVIAIDKIAQQIKIVETRRRILQQYNGNSSDEVEALKYLNARRYYKKYEHLFPWVITNDTLIEALIKKYKLQNVSFSSYSKSVPHEATDELEKFGKAWEKVVDDENHKPSIRLITDYQGPEHKKDPILIVSSPFGRWWYILGAWDKEVEIVDEIIYRGK